MVIRRATGAEDETLLEIHASAFRRAELEPPEVALVPAFHPAVAGRFAYAPAFDAVGA